MGLEDVCQNNQRSIPFNSSRTSLEKGGDGITPDILVYTILR